MTSTLTEQSVEQLITQSFQLIGTDKESELCRYLPASQGGHMHHFTFRKLKQNDQNTLCSLLTEYIITNPKPQKIASKARASRGSRTRLGLGNLSKEDMQRLLLVVTKEGDSELIKKLTPKPSIKSVKTQLIQSIKMGRADVTLWNSFVEFVASKS